MTTDTNRIAKSRVVVTTSFCIFIVLAALYAFYEVQHRFDTQLDIRLNTGLSNLAAANQSAADSLNNVTNDAESLLGEISRNSTISNLLMAMENGGQPVDAAEIGSGFARNFLTAEATRSGLFASGVPATIRSDLQGTPVAGGILLVDDEGRPLVSSIGAPSMTGQLPPMGDAPHLLTLAGTQYVAFSSRVPPDNDAVVNAAVVGLTPLDRVTARVAPALSTTAATGISNIVARLDDAAVVLLAGNGEPDRRLSVDFNSNRTILQAAQAPGTVHRGLSATGIRTAGLAELTAIPTIAVVSELDIAAIEQSVQQARYASLAAVILAALFLIATILYVGRLATASHSAAGRAEDAAELSEKKYENLLLKSVLDAIGDEIVVRDKNNAVVFRNKPGAVGSNGQSENKLTYTRPFLSEIEGNRGSITVVQSPTAHSASQLADTAAVESALNAIVSELDKRDRYSADHSLRVAETAAAVARRMGIDAVTMRRIGLAGRLLNIGKLRVSRDLLADDKPFDAETKETVRREIASVADILRSNGGDDPFIDMLEQAFERLDGSGFPKGLSGGAIGTPARILAVANTWVALTSPRPHRLSISRADALAILRRDTPHGLDPVVVDALEAECGVAGE